MFSWKSTVVKKDTSNTDTRITSKPSIPVFVLLNGLQVNPKSIKYENYVSTGIHTGVYPLNISKDYAPTFPILPTKVAQIPKVFMSYTCELNKKSIEFIYYSLENSNRIIPMCLEVHVIPSVFIDTDGTNQWYSEFPGPVQEYIHCINWTKVPSSRIKYYYEIGDPLSSGKDDSNLILSNNDLKEQYYPEQVGTDEELDVLSDNEEILNLDLSRLTEILSNKRGDISKELADPNNSTPTKYYVDPTPWNSYSIDPLQISKLYRKVSRLEEKVSETSRGLVYCSVIATIWLGSLFLDSSNFNNLKSTTGAVISHLIPT